MAAPDPVAVAVSDPAAVRDALGDAVARFLTTAEAITPDQWDRPATDGWDVRQLFAHMVRGMAIVSEYLDAGGAPSVPGLADAADYFRTGLSPDGVHAAIARRGVDTAAGAPDDLLEWARQVAAAMLTRVAVTEDDVTVVHAAGWLRFDDYLVTRVAELVLHTFDLQMACALEVDAPPTALAVVVPVLLALADRADQAALAMALTGRVGPLTCNVFC